MENKTKEVLSWEEVFTADQEKRLIDAVLAEINKLRESPALKDLIDDYLRLGSFNTGPHIGDTYELKIGKDGTLLEDHSYMWYGERTYDNNQSVNPQRLRELIESYKITPKHITEIRRKIEQ